MKINIENLAIKLLYIVAAGIVVAQVLGMFSISSLLFSCTFVMVLVFWVIVSSKRIGKINLLGAAIVILAFTSVLLNAMFTGTMISFGYMKKVIIFSSTILFFVAASEMKVDIGNKIFIRRLIDLLIVFLIIMYFIQNRAMHILYGRVSNYLTFRFTNPNLTAIFLTSILLYKIITMLQKKYIVNKITDLVLIAFIIKFIIETRARNCMLVIVIFMVQMIVYIAMPKFKIFTKKVYAKCIAVLPLAFAVVYMLVIRIPVINYIFSFLVSEGKDINSRHYLWSLSFDQISNSPIIGAYSQLSRGTGEFQMHNTHIDIVSSYGVIVLVLVIIFLYSVLWKKINRSTGRQDLLYSIAFASILMSGIGEAALFSGGLGIYIFAGLFLLLKGEKPTNEKNSVHKQLSDTSPNTIL